MAVLAKAFCSVPSTSETNLALLCRSKKKEKGTSGITVWVEFILQNWEIGNLWIYITEFFSSLTCYFTGETHIQADKQYHLSDKNCLHAEQLALALSVAHFIHWHTECPRDLRNTPGSIKLKKTGLHFRKKKIDISQTDPFWIFPSVSCP